MTHGIGVHDVELVAQGPVRHEEVAAEPAGRLDADLQARILHRRGLQHPRHQAARHLLLFLGLAVIGLQLRAGLDQPPLHGGDALHGPHLGQQQGEIDGLADVVVATGLEPTHHVHALAQGADEDDGHPAVAVELAQAAGGLVAVDARQHHVHQHHVRGLLGKQLQGRLAGLGHHHLVALLLQGLARQDEVLLDVVHHQDLDRLPHQAARPSSGSA